MKRLGGGGMDSLSSSVSVPVPNAFVLSKYRRHGPGLCERSVMRINSDTGVELSMMTDLDQIVLSCQPT